MKTSAYDMRRPMFWLVTLMGITLALLISLRSGFSHPLRLGGELAILAAIWGTYFGIRRDLNAAHGEIADNLSIRVEISVGWCCILGYILATSATV
jgi:hypothetical protein